MQSQDSVWKARLPVLAQTLATRGWAVGGQLLSLSHTRPCLQGLPPCVTAPWLLISDPPAPLALQTACAAGRPGALSSSAASVVPVPADASRAQSVREPWFAFQCPVPGAVLGLLEEVSSYDHFHPRAFGITVPFGVLPRGTGSRAV